MSFKEVHKLAAIVFTNLVGFNGMHKAESF